MPISTVGGMGNIFNPKEAKEVSEATQLLRKSTVEDARRALMSGDITRKAYDQFLKDKADDEVGQLIADNGPLKAMVLNTLRMLEKGWENYKEGWNSRTPGGEKPKGEQSRLQQSVGDLYNSGLQLWGMLQVVGSLIGGGALEVTGKMAKDFALSNGMSPGFAELFGLSVEVGPSFIPIGTGARSTVKTIQRFTGSKTEAARTREAVGAIKNIAAQEAPDSGMSRWVKMVTEELNKPAPGKLPSGAQSTYKGTEDDLMMQIYREVYRPQLELGQVVEKGSGTQRLGEVSDELRKLAQSAAPDDGADRFVRMYLEELNKTNAGKLPSKEQAQQIVDNTKKIQEIYREVYQPQMHLPDHIIEDPVERVVVQGLSNALTKDGVEGAEVLLGKTANALPKPAEGVMATIKPFAESAATHTKRISTAEAIKEIPELAKKFGVDPQGLVLPGAPRSVRPYTERQIYGYLKALDENVKTLGELANKAVTSGDEVDMIAFMKHTSNMFRPTAEGTSEALVSQPLTDFLTHWAPESMARGDIMGAINDFAVSMQRFSPEQLTQFTFGNQQGFLRTGNLWATTKEMYANLLLPMAWASATVGNTMVTARHFAETFASAAFSADKAAGRSLGEAFIAPQGMFYALGDAFKAANAKFWETGAQTVGRFDNRQVIPGVVGRTIRKPTDAVMAVDEFFGTILERTSLYQSGYKAAQRAGIPENQIPAYLKHHVETAWFTNIDAWQEAQELRKSGTFQNELGTAGKYFQNLVQGNTVAAPAFFWFPFVKSFLNLTKDAWNHTPALQFASTTLYKDIAAGGTKADDAIGRLTISNFVSYYIYELAKHGFITGRGPQHPTAREAWIAQGNQPYSVNTPWGKLSLENMEPLSSPIKLIADFASIADQLDDRTFEQTSMAMLQAVTHAFVNTGAWTMVAKLGDAVQGLDRGLWTEGVRDTLLAPWIAVRTGGPAFKRAADIIDPVVKDTWTYTDEIMSRIPFYSKDVPPKLDASGKVMIPPQAPGWSWFGMLSPLIPRFKADNNDPIDKLFERLEVRYPQFDRNVGGTVPNDISLREFRAGDRLGADLTPKQSFEWKRRWYDAYRAGLQADVLDTEDFKATTNDAQKRVLVEAYLQQQKSAQFLELLKNNKDIMTKIQESTIKANSPLLKPEDRAEFAQDIRMMNIYDTMTEDEKSNVLKWGDVSEPVEGTPNEAR